MHQLISDAILEKEVKSERNDCYIVISKIKTIYSWPIFWLICLVLQGLLVVRTGTISMTGVLLSAYVYFFAMPACGYFVYRLSPIKIGYLFSAWLLQTPAIFYVNGQTGPQQTQLLIAFAVIQVIAIVSSLLLHKIVM